MNAAETEGGLQELLYPKIFKLILGY
jgi:hypothetical protein